MLGQLKSQMTQTVTGLGLTSLADIGIGVPEVHRRRVDRGRQGRQADVRHRPSSPTALNADYTKVRDLFAGKGATQGHLDALIGDYVDGADRHQRHAHRPDDHRRHDAEGLHRPDHASSTTAWTTEQTRLKAQFAAMETALNNSQTQQAWLTSQISSLPLARMSLKNPAHGRSTE